MGLMFSEDKKRIIEALLFVSKEPLSEKNLVQILELSENDVQILLDELIEEYDHQNRGISIKAVANGYLMYTRPEYSPYIEKLYKPQNSCGLSKAALETLAIIAYKQPITRAEVEVIRGVKADSSIGNLLEKNLVKEVGRKEGPGRPIIFGTSSTFLKYFGLNDIADLPDPEEFAQRAAQMEDNQTEENQTEE